MVPATVPRFLICIDESYEIIMQDSELLDYMEQALEEPIGLVLECNDPDGIRRRCNSLRLQQRKDGIYIYDCLQFKASPTSKEELVIVHDRETDTASDS